LAPPLRVLLVDDGSPHLPLLREELARSVARCSACSTPRLNCGERAQLDPDLVIIGADSPSRDTLEHIAVMSQSARGRSCCSPTIRIASHAARDPRRVSSYVVAGSRRSGCARSSTSLWLASKPMRNCARSSMLRARAAGAQAHRKSQRHLDGGAWPLRGRRVPEMRKMQWTVA